MHGIMENDTMFSGNGIRPWHGLGTVIEGTVTSDEAIKLANLGWDVIQEPVYLKNGIEIPNLFANIRSDTNDLLGTVKDKYTIVQNKEAFAFTDNIIKNSKGIDAKYETAGSLFNGKRVFMLVRLPDVDLVGDKVENYLFVSTAHDGSQGLMAGITNVRVVCNNTLQMAERGAQFICAHIRNQVFEGDTIQVVLSGSMHCKLPSDVYVNKLIKRAEEISGRKLEFIKLQVAPVMGCINWMLED